MSDSERPIAVPSADRPYMPGYGILAADQGSGLLPWSWANERLEKAANYWVVSVRPDGRPHAMPVWAIWLDNCLWYSTGVQSRKALNLAANPNCVVSIEVGTEAVIVEGINSIVEDAEMLRRFSAVYGPKYKWNMEGFKDPIYIVRPTKVIAFQTANDEFARSATRWTFTRP